jgi:predicted RNA-binding protein
MAYFLDLFSPETYEAFKASSQDISGFRLRQRNAASHIKPGDLLICYVTKLSRWIGILKVSSNYFEDDTPIFYKKDPFVIRFKVKTIVWLDLEKAPPIHEDFIWKTLSFTKDHDKNSTTWTGIVRVSLRELPKDDGQFLEQILHEQAHRDRVFKLSDDDQRKLKRIKIRTQDNVEVAVSIPEANKADKEEKKLTRESIRIQALLAQIGERMGMKIWLPKADRNRILQHWKPEYGTLIDELPLNYNEGTLRTIEQIDVLWIRRSSIIRAFEVEHTTSIYSGILRMADLMALQPNLDIRAHIVDPVDRKEKVFEEITRPVFALLDKGPLAESCTFISYDSIIELSQEKHLEHMTDSVLDEFTEDADF